MTDSATTKTSTKLAGTPGQSALIPFAERFGLSALLVALLLFFGLLAPSSALFFSDANVHNIMANQSVTGLIALATVITLVAGYFDISLAAIAGVSSVATAALVVQFQVPFAWAALAALVVAALVGVINAVLVTTFDLDPFIVTLGMYVLLNGLVLAYTQGSIISGLPPEVGAWGAARWFGIARPFCLLIVAAVIIWYMLAQTPYGRKLAAIGSNRTAAELAGLRVKRHVFIAYVLGAAVAGIAGILLTVRSGSADAVTGSSFIFPALAAVFLGQTTIKPGYPNVWGTIIGVFLVAVAVNGLTLLGTENWISQVFNGAALVLAVAFSTLMARVRDRAASKVHQKATPSSLKPDAQLVN